MKQGYQIEIQSNLSATQYNRAIKYAEEFIKDTNYHYGSWKHRTSGGYDRRLARGVVGITLDVRDRIAPNDELVFRRASKGRRIFQIVLRNLVVNPEYDNRCVCGEHMGGSKAIVKYGDIPCEVYYTTGEIKG